MYQATNESFARANGSIFCPCRKCLNDKYLEFNLVKKHLYNRGFMSNYYLWLRHGEGCRDSAGSSNMNYGVVEPTNYYENYGHHQESDQGYNHENRFHDMVTDAFHETTAAFHENIIEEPNVDAQRFYDMLDAANKPIYEECREGQSKLSLASRMMTIKADNNLSENCMDSWAELIKEYLIADNISAESYYEIQKLVSSLGLPSEMIDVCIDYCMIFWKDDENLQECRFCGKPRYQPTGRRTRVPYKRMWYLPITDRLKRLYQSERTAAKMRWHAEHSTVNGEVTHPSDAKAWKHFQTVYPDFASECRNVYLGLCTDGFSPFGMSGRQYSLWNHTIFLQICVCKANFCS